MQISLPIQTSQLFHWTHILKVTWHTTKYGDSYSEFVLYIYPSKCTHTHTPGAVDTHTHTHRAVDTQTHTSEHTHLKQWTHTDTHQWTHTHTAVNTHTHTPPEQWTHTHTHTHLEQWTHTHTSEHTHTWSSGHTHQWTHTPGPVDTHTEQWTHTHLEQWTYTHTHTHTHTHPRSSGLPVMLRHPGSSWGFGVLLKGTSVVVLRVERALDIHSPHLQSLPDRDSNSQPLDYESDSNH